MQLLSKKANNIFFAGIWLVLFFLVWYFINTKFGLAIDTKVTHSIYNFGHSDFLVYFFIFVSNYTIGELIGVIIMLAYGAWKKDKYFLIVSSLFILLLLLTDWGFKIYFGRLRPFMSQININNLSDYVNTDYSFPSGHTVFAFFIAHIIINRFKLTGMKKIGLYCLAILVGFSRIYLGVHYFWDVTAGACLGLAWGTVAVYSMNKIEKIYSPTIE